MNLQTYTAEFLTISLIHFLAVASPGPDFAIVLRQSVSHGKKCGVYTSLGIAVGVLFHVTYCILGLGILISKSVLAFNIVKFMGAGYLVYVGISAVKSKKRPLSIDEIEPTKAPHALKSFSSGFITNVLNPKATLFFLAVFSVTVSATTPAGIKLLYGIWMMIATAVWFGGLALLFSKTTIRSFLQKSGHWFERSMGAILIALGIRLALARAE